MANETRRPPVSSGAVALYLGSITLHNGRLLSLIWVAITVGALVYVLIAVKGGLRLTPLLSNLALPL
jgi:hypothetical protein